MSKRLNIFVVSAVTAETSGPVVRELVMRYHTVWDGYFKLRRQRDLEHGGGKVLLPDDEVAFNSFTLQTGMADLFVLVLPSDQNAACLAGMAHISGVPVAVVGERSQECCFTLRGCVQFWCDNTDVLLRVIAEWPDLGTTPEEDA